MDARIRELARRSQNFGLLAPHEPLLVLDGASAEAHVYTDPDSAMFKARRFTETLTRKLVAQTRTRVGDNASQDARIRALALAGVLVPDIRQAFDDVRRTGNRAVHTHFGDVRAALDAVRTCFELGIWLHRAITGDREPRAFVPPPAPEPPAVLTEEDRVELERLRQELAGHRDRLTEVLLHRDATVTELQAQRRARADAERALAQASADQDRLRTTVDELDTQVAELTEAFEAQVTRPARVSAAQRDAFIDSAQRAARAPLTEAEVRAEVDRMLAAAGWQVQDASAANLFAGQGVALREVGTASGPADYLLYVDRALVGVIEAKREGQALSSVEGQSARYARNLTAQQRLQAWRDPLPFRYETTAVETHVTNTLDPRPRAREVFSFHRPETLARWMREAEQDPQAPTLRARLRRLPALDERGLRPAQVEAIQGLERSLARDQPRALIQMATGAGKTYTVVAESYRLLKHAGAHRILFLVDRNNLGAQARTEYENYVTPDDGRKLTELFNADRLASGGMLDSTKVVISTVQRLYAVLRGQPVDPEVEDEAFDSYDVDEVVEVGYNPAVPPETFDVIVVDECHRSIYGRWRQVLEYFDAYLVGLTATPVNQTFGFFHQNLVAEYTYPQAVSDGVNVDFDVYRIRTRQTEQGDTIEAHTVVPRRDRRTRRQRYEELEEDLAYGGEQLGRDVISKGQLRLILETFRDRLFTEIFPGRTYVPKTLIFARDDNHAEEIVQLVREVFAERNEFCQKITYSVRDPQKLLAAFRNTPELRIAVTVDMIATGTDVRPLECVFFLRNVRSWAYFEQMKGRGSRTLDPAELARVTPDAGAKDRFVIVDAVGVTDSPRVDASPLQQLDERQVSFAQLLRKAGTLTISVDETSSLAARIARLNHQLSPDERAELERVAGMPLAAVVGSLSRVADPDQLARAEQRGPPGVRELVEQAVQPVAANPELRARLLEIRRAHDITYDEANRDELLEAAGVDPRVRAEQVVTSWRDYLAEHRDEITAIELSFRHGGRSVYTQLKELARRIERPPQAWTPERLWRAYERLELAAERPGRVYGPVDLIGLIRYELGLDSEPRPHRSVVEEHFAAWLRKQEQSGVRFTGDQLWWLERIRDVVISSASFEHDDLDDVPFAERGGTDGFLQTFGSDRAEAILTDLTQVLAL